MITVTLNQIKKSQLCSDGWEKVVRVNGGLNADYDKPFPLVSLLDSNGLADTLHVILNVPEMEDHEVIWCKFSRFCALQNVEKISNYCSRTDYDLILEWLETGDKGVKSAVRSAVRSVQSVVYSAQSAGQSTTYSALLSAVRSVAWSVWSVRSAQSAVRSAQSAAWSVSQSAAWSVSQSTAQSTAQSAQSAKLKELLNQKGQ